MGDTIKPYVGEMFTSPVPLELSGNYCSHGCSMCFANLGNRERIADVESTIRLLSEFRERESWEAKLLSLGYPVLISNKVDPFSNSNYQQMVPIMRLMTDLGVPISIQTRGGRGIDEVLEFLKPSVWYVSISMLDDSLRKKIEPGAPTIDSRFELIEKVIRKGHRAVVGFNPCVEEWQPDPKPLLERVVKSGAHGVWIEKLHFSSRLTSVMTDREKKAIGDKLIVEGRKKRSEPFWSYFMRAREEAMKLMPVFSIYQPNASSFFDPWRELYERTFPTVQDFVNVCHEVKPDLITFGDYVEFMLSFMPNEKWPWGHCLAVSSNAVFQTHKIPNQMTTLQFLHLCWMDARIKQAPARGACFAYATVGEGDEESVLVDEYELPVMTFTSDLKGFDDYYSRVELPDAPEARPARPRKTLDGGKRAVVK